jgi:mevalonate kinase
MENKKNRISVPGKIILSGEHSVVYGYPALLSAINKRLIIDENLEIISNIPIGSGMGSSASYCVALSAMKMKLKTGRINKNKVYEEAYLLEKMFHGNSSGADPAICTYGGYLYFRKESEKIKTFSKIKPKRNLPNIFLYNTGRPIETTGKMVERVWKKYQENTKQITNIFNNIEKITKSFLKYLTKESIDVGPLIKDNEKLLEELDVVSKKTKEIVEKIEKIGGSAKITGAGGKKEFSGLILIYHPDKEKLLNFFEKQKLNFMEIKLGEKGLRVDH